MNKKMTVGWIGCGVMGLSMAKHLMGEGDQKINLIVYSRTRAKCESLEKLGAQIVDSPKAVADIQDVNVIFLMAGFPSDTDDIVYNKETGILAASREKPPHIVDMATGSPSAAKTLSEKLRVLGVDSLDAPVSGGDVGARERRLAIMVGGSKQLYDEMLPLFKRMTTGQICYFGGAGMGQHAKMANQITIASNMIGVCEGLLYAHKVGLDVEQCLNLIMTGAASSFSLSVLAPRVLQGDLNPGFFVEHFVKDLRIALEEAEAAGLTYLPGLKLAFELYSKLVKIGKGKYGTQALIMALDEMNGNGFSKSYLQSHA